MLFLGDQIFPSAQSQTFYDYPQYRPLSGVMRKSISGGWTSESSQKRKFASSPLPLKSNRILAHRDAGGGSPSTASRTDFALEHFKAKDVY